MSKQACKRLRRALGMEVNRTPMPHRTEGGRAIAYLAADGGRLCGPCVNGNVGPVACASLARNRKRPADPCLAIVGVVDVTPGRTVRCSECGRYIDRHHEPADVPAAGA